MHCSHTAHINDMSHVTKMRVNITMLAMGTVVPMSKVEGSWVYYQVYEIQHLHVHVPIMIMWCNPHAHAHYW